MASLYDLSVPVVTKLLNTAKHSLQKGEAHFKEAGKPDNYICGLRLYPDMYHVSGQVIVFNWVVKKLVVRLHVTASDPDPAAAHGIDDSRPDFQAEHSLPKLYALLDESLALLKSLNQEDVDQRDLSAKFNHMMPRNRVEPVTDTQILQFLLIPNCHFHNVMIYSILRSNGVALGKLDYLSQLVDF